jgi:hypothetical protein
MACFDVSDVELLESATIVTYLLLSWRVNYLETYEEINKYEQPKLLKFFTMIVVAMLCTILDVNETT